MQRKKKISNLTNKVAQLSEKEYHFVFEKIYSTGNNGYHNFLVFDPMLSFLILDSNKKVTKWILTGISSEKIKPFETNIYWQSNLKIKQLCFNVKKLFFIIQKLILN